MSLKYMGVPNRCPHGEYEDRCKLCDLQRQIDDRNIEIGGLKKDIIRLQDEVKYLRYRSQSSDDQLHQIAQFLGGDATNVVNPECDRTIAGFVKQEFNRLKNEIKHLAEKLADCNLTIDNLLREWKSEHDLYDKGE